jgi:hypothetical protein
VNTSEPGPQRSAPRSGQAWPEGWTKLHVYLTELDEVKPVADSYRPVLNAIPGEHPVPHQWLHATVASIECDAATLDAPVRHDLVERLRGRLAELPAFDLTIGPALASAGAVMLDTYPDEAFQRLVATCVAVIDDAVDGGHARPCGGPGHVSLSYRPDSVGVDRERGETQNRLRDVRPGRTAVRVTGVDLVEVFQGDDAGSYTWRVIARIPLGE